MGKAIEEILIQRGHEVVLKISRTPLAEELNPHERILEYGVTCNTMTPYV